MALRCPFMSNWAGLYTNSEFKTTDCIESLCQVWNGTNCGANNITIVNNNNANANTTSNDMMTLITYLQDVLGKHEDKDKIIETNDTSLLKYLQNILGKHEDKDKIDTVNDASLLKYLKDIIGKHEDKDKIDSDNDASLLKYLKDIMGEHKDLSDSTNVSSHLLNLKMSIIELMNHEHKKHLHTILPDQHLDENDPLTKYINYAIEGVSLVDLDGNNKVYGKDGRIPSSSFPSKSIQYPNEEPPMLKSVGK